MGIVYRARDRRLGRDVALKRMPDTLKDHPRAVELFLREARAAAALNHQNIVTVYDVDVESGVYFITMELLEGLDARRPAADARPAAGARRRTARSPGVQRPRLRARAPHRPPRHQELEPVPDRASAW